MKKMVIACILMMLFSATACSKSKKTEPKQKSSSPSKSVQTKDGAPAEIDLSKRARYSIQPVDREGDVTNQLFRNGELIDAILPSYNANCENVTCGVSSLFLGDGSLYFLYLESGESENENQRYSFYYYSESLNRLLHATKSDSFSLSDPRNKFEIKDGALSYTVFPTEPTSSYVYQKKGAIKFYNKMATPLDKKPKIALATLLDLLTKSSKGESYDPLKYFDEDYYYYMEETNERYLGNLPGPSFANSFFLNSYATFEVSPNNKVSSKGDQFFEISLVNSTEDGNTDFIISATFNESGRIISISERL